MEQYVKRQRFEVKEAKRIKRKHRSEYQKYLESRLEGNQDENDEVKGTIYG